MEEAKEEKIFIANGNSMLLNHGSREFSFSPESRFPWFTAKVRVARCPVSHAPVNHAPTHMAWDEVTEGIKGKDAP